MLADHYPVYDEQAHYHRLVQNEVGVADAIFTTLYKLDRRFVMDLTFYRVELFRFTEKWSLNVERFVNPKGYED